MSKLPQSGRHSCPIFAEDQVGLSECTLRGESSCPAALNCMQARDAQTHLGMAVLVACTSVEVPPAANQNQPENTQGQCLWPAPLLRCRLPPINTSKQHTGAVLVAYTSVEVSPCCQSEPASNTQGRTHLRRETLSASSWATRSLRRASPSRMALRSSASRSSAAAWAAMIQLLAVGAEPAGVGTVQSQLQFSQLQHQLTNLTSWVETC